jgi:integrase
MTRSKRFQHGSLFKRGKRKKMWVARWWEDVRAADGTADRTRRSEVIGSVADLPTRREAERELSERLRRINAGDCQPSSVRTFGDFVESAWLPEVLPTLKYSTKQHYKYVVRLHLLPAFGDMQLRSITRERVQQFLAAKSLSGLSWKTCRHIRTVFGTVMGAAEIAGYINSNPVRTTRLPRRGLIEERPAIAPENIRALLAVLPEPSRSVASLLVFTGMRVGELLALRWRDVDLTNRTVRVRRTVYEGHFDEPKTKRSNRTVPLGPKGIEILAALQPANLNPDALVYATRKGTPLSRRNLLNRQLRPAAAKLGLMGINWHWLRHANVTLHDSVGTPLGTVQALVGHSSPELLQEIYLHSVPADAKQAMQKVEEVLSEANGPKWTQVLSQAKVGSSLIQ